MVWRSKGSEAGKIEERGEGWYRWREGRGALRDKWRERCGRSAS